MTTVRFFDVFSLLKVKELATIGGPSSFTAGLHGSVNGTLDIEVTPANASFLKLLKENSHYLKVATDNYSIFGAIVDSAVINNGICRMSIIGFPEYTEKMEMVSNHKATSIGNYTKVAESDESFTSIYYSDTAVGLYWSLLLNLQDTVTARGYPAFFDASGLESFITSNTDQNWGKSYRLNSLEFPTVKSVIDNILSDSEMDLIKVTVDNSDTFAWKLSVVSSYNLVHLNRATSQIVNIALEPGNDISRAFSFATGSDLQDDTVASMQPFDQTVAYSSLIAGSPSDRTSAIDRINANARADSDKKLGQVTFTSDSTAIKLLDAVSITGSKSPTILAVITQIAIDNKQVNYTGQVVTTVGSIIKGVTKPANVLSKILVDPLQSTQAIARRTAFKKPGTSGWRS